ncbi:unnamed protein product [Closterium sp. Yama58-4]|nr:unnamed protein product [Closterium sp. Yama58-4]
MQGVGSYRGATEEEGELPAAALADHACAAMSELQEAARTRGGEGKEKEGEEGGERGYEVGERVWAAYMETLNHAGRYEASIAAWPHVMAIKRGTGEWAEGEEGVMGDASRGRVGEWERAARGTCTGSREAAADGGGDLPGLRACNAHLAALAGAAVAASGAGGSRREVERRGEEAEGFFRVMLRAERGPLTAAVNALLHMYLHQSRLNDLERRFQGMKEIGCLPDRTSYHLRLAAHTKAGNLGMAKKIFLEMTSNQDIGVDAHTYNLVIAACGAAGDTRSVRSLYLDMVGNRKDRGKKPGMVLVGAAREAAEAVVGKLRVERDETWSMKLSKEQRQVLAGVLLGGARIATQDNERTYEIHFEQPLDNPGRVELLEGLYRAFGSWASAPPRNMLLLMPPAPDAPPDAAAAAAAVANAAAAANPTPSSSSSTAPPADVLAAAGVRPIRVRHFATIPHTALRYHAQRYHPQGPRVIPKLIQRWLTPKTLAHWYMYSGRRCEETGGIILHAKQYSSRDLRRIARALCVSVRDCSVKMRVRGKEGGWEEDEEGERMVGDSVMGREGRGEVRGEEGKVGAEVWSDDAWGFDGQDERERDEDEEDEEDEEEEEGEEEDDQEEGEEDEDDGDGDWDDGGNEEWEEGEEAELDREEGDAGEGQSDEREGRSVGRAGLEQQEEPQEEHEEHEGQEGHEGHEGQEEVDKFERKRFSRGRFREREKEKDTREEIGLNEWMPLGLALYMEKVQTPVFKKKPKKRRKVEGVSGAVHGEGADPRVQEETQEAEVMQLRVLGLERFRKNAIADLAAPSTQRTSLPSAARVTITGGMAAVSADAVCAWLLQTTSADEATVRSASSALEEASKHPGFLGHVLSVAAVPNSPAALPAVLYFKNVAVAKWRGAGSKGRVQLPGGKEEQEAVRVQLVEVLLRCGQGKILSVLIEAFSVVVRTELASPSGWPQLLPGLKAALLSSDLIRAVGSASTTAPGPSDPASAAAATFSTVTVLTVLRAVTKPYRYFLDPTNDKEPVPPVLEAIASDLLLPLMPLMHHLLAAQAQQPNPQAPSAQDEALLLILKTLHLSVQSHMPSAIRKHIDSIVPELLLLLSHCPPNLAAAAASLFPPLPTTAPPLLFGLPSPFPLHLPVPFLFPSRCLSHPPCAPSRHFPAMVDGITGIVCNSLWTNKLPLAARRVIAVAFTAISQVLDSAPGWKVVAPQFAHLLEAAIFPALCLHPQDLELWDEDEEEYVRRNLPTDLDDMDEIESYDPRQCAAHLLALIATSKGSPAKGKPGATGAAAPSKSTSPAAGRRRQRRPAATKDTDAAAATVVLPFLSRFPLPADAAVALDGIFVAGAGGGQAPADAASAAVVHALSASQPIGASAISYPRFRFPLPQVILSLPHLSPRPRSSPSPHLGKTLSASQPIGAAAISPPPPVPFPYLERQPAHLQQLTYPSVSCSPNLTSPTLSPSSPSPPPPSLHPPQYFERQPAQLEQLLPARVLPLFSQRHVSAVLLASATWLLGELSAALPESLHSPVYEASMKAMAAGDAEGQSWAAVRTAASHCISYLIQNEVEPSDWLAFLQAVVAATRAGEEKEAVRALDLLESVAVEGGEGVHSHLPAIISAVADDTCAALPPPDQPWSQRVWALFSALASLVESWADDELPGGDEEEEEEGEERGGKEAAGAEERSRRAVEVAASVARVLRVAWLNEPVDLSLLKPQPAAALDGEEDKEPPPTSWFDASLLLSFVLKAAANAPASPPSTAAATTTAATAGAATAGDAAALVAQWGVVPLLHKWVELVAEWTAWEEDEDEAVFQTIDSLLLLQGRTPVPDFISWAPPPPPLPPVPPRSILEGIACFVSSALSDGSPAATWRASRHSHTLLNAAAVALNGGPAAAALAARFAEPALDENLDDAELEVALSRGDAPRHHRRPSPHHNASVRSLFTTALFSLFPMTDPIQPTLDENLDDAELEAALMRRYAEAAKMIGSLEEDEADVEDEYGVELELGLQDEQAIIRACLQQHGSSLALHMLTFTPLLSPTPARPFTAGLTGLQDEQASIRACLQQHWAALGRQVVALKPSLSADFAQAFPPAKPFLL